MKTIILAAALALMAAGAPTVSGTWSMSIDSPHGTMKASLSLKQDGTKVTGSFSGPLPDMAVEGTFQDGTLKVETAGDAEHKFVFQAKLKDDGTLAGYLSTEHGDMKWTAERVE